MREVGEGEREERREEKENAYLLSRDGESGRGAVHRCQWLGGDEERARGGEGR